MASFSPERECSSHLGVSAPAGINIHTTADTESVAATSVNGQQVPGVRISSPLNLFSQENTASVSAVALLFALLTPPEITPYPDLPDPRSIPGTWSVLQPLLSVAVPTFFQSSRDGHHGGPSGGGNFGGGAGGQSRGGAGRGGGGHGRDPSSSRSSRHGGAGHSGYYAQNNLPSNGSNTYGRFSSMTMRHCGTPSVFNPTRRLVEITSEQLLAPQEARTESPAPVSDDSATDTASLSTAPTSPEVDDICLPHVHAHKPAHLDILHAVQWGASAMVLGASLIVADEIPFPVVLKIVKQPNFQLVANELAAYRQLARLCIVVPKLIALMAPAHERGWVAMVIEDAGKSFGCGGQSWDQIFLTASERIGIYLALVQIHAEGVVHGDPEPRNVVRRRGGTPCFVDFGLATVGHKCDRGTCEELMYLRSTLELENR
ncbi:hypothetical protein B0H14DRAFT_2610444 [Mycena olivaceomarginata]|nr:hypothetical protein B0H14DRAFT_2610444 [Mycena olivaceomarginata]